MVLYKKNTNNALKSLPTTQMAFNLYEANGSEFLEYGLPFPNTIVHGNGFVRIMWLMAGYMHTQKSRDYYNDIVARFLISFSEYKSQRIPYKLEEIQNHTQHELKSFQALESIQKRAFNVSRANGIKFKDAVFLSIKFYAEHLIRERGVCQYELMEDYALTNFLDRKDFSTLRSKCRNIFYWYEARDFKPDSSRIFNQTKEEYRVTRIENMKKINATKVDINYKKVVNLLTGLFSTEYKKKNGKWHYGKICEALSLSPNTVKKYVKEFEVG